MSKETRRAVFLDRDGVINRKAPEGDYVKCWNEFEFLPGAKEAIGKLNQEGLLVVIVSNQRGIGRGVMSEDDLKEIHSRMEDELKEERAEIDGIYYCPHDINDQCHCRKPEPSLLLSAAKEHDIDLEHSWIIGDREADIEAGKRVGCRGILIWSLLDTDRWPGKTKPHLTASSLADAVKRLLADESMHAGKP